MTLTSLTWIDMSVVLTIVGISLEVGKRLQKLDNVIDDVKEFKGYEKRLTVLETRCGEIEKNLAADNHNCKCNKKKNVRGFKPQTIRQK